MDVARLFSVADLEAVRQAAAEAEAGTGGEVVSYVVGRCDPYPEARPRAAAALAVFAALAAGLAHALGEHWGGWGLWWITLPVVAGGLLGWSLVGMVPVVERFMIGPEMLSRRAEQRAIQAFLTEEVFSTRDRTGVLILLAVFERQVVIKADTGLAAQVKLEEWQRIVGDLAYGIRAGKAAESLIATIHACGDLMRERGVPRRADDTDELPNALRISDV